jgi:hypothetical protein
VAFAAFHFQRSRAGHLGATQGAHLDAAQRVAARRGNAVAGPAEPPCPAAARHVWGWFMELNQGRQATSAGAQALTYAEIDSWARLTGRRPSPWEVRLLKRLDGLFLQTHVEN